MSTAAGYGETVAGVLVDASSSASSPACWRHADTTQGSRTAMAREDRADPRPRGSRGDGIRPDGRRSRIGGRSDEELPRPGVVRRQDLVEVRKRLLLDEDEAARVGHHPDHRRARLVLVLDIYAFTDRRPIRPRQPRERLVDDHHRTLRPLDLQEPAAPVLGAEGAPTSRRRTLTGRLSRRWLATALPELSARYEGERTRRGPRHALRCRVHGRVRDVVERADVPATGGRSARREIARRARDSAGRPVLVEGEGVQARAHARTPDPERRPANPDLLRVRPAAYGDSPDWRPQTGAGPVLPTLRVACRCDL